jgi:hypothetical protein
MARIDIRSNGGGSVAEGVLQLENGVALDTTLRSVADQNNTTSPLKLSTTAVQVNSPLRITTSDASGFYLDAEDSATNNRFSIKRDPSSQEVTLDFASNPSGSTSLVGAIRTYQDGVNLSNAMSFIEDGSVGIGTNTPIGILHLKRTAATTRMVMDGDAGQSKIITYRTAGLQRFGLYVNNTAESGSNAGSDFAIRAYSDAGTLITTALFIKRSTGNVGINTITGTAKLQVVGSGSTSATTSLLVQNSAGNPMLTITDDRTTTIEGGTTSLVIRDNLGNNSTFGNGQFKCPQAITRQSSGLVTFLGTNNNAIAWNFDHNNSQQTTSTGVSMINIGGGYTTQQGAQFSSLSIQPTYDLNANTNTNSIARGIYYNPTITNLRVAKHYGIQTTSGGAYINTATPDATAALQADSTTQGFLPPRMTNVQRAAITTPAIGLMVYCTDVVEGLYVYKSTGWTFVI